MSDQPKKPGLFEELRQRQVLRAAGLYLVVAWLLLQVGETTFDALGLPDGSQRFLIVLLALGFPIAMVLAWIFDPTPYPDGPIPNDPDAAMARLRTGRQIDFSIIGALLLVVLLQWQPWSETGIVDPLEKNPKVTGTHKPGIAVLPFCNLSGDPDQVYFSDGITEELTAVLARSPELLVISRSSSSRQECQPPDLKLLGRELGVRYAVEGSVRRAQDRVRITAQLIDATTDVHVWSESYEREFTPASVFAIQTDIAQRISEALQVPLRDWEGRQLSDDPTAWDLYMRAYYLQNRLVDAEGLLETRRMLERAIELDPEFASAHALLAGNRLLQYSVSGPSDRQAELVDRAQVHARQSLALDPQNAAGHFGLSWVFMLKGKTEDAVREARRSIELNPSLDYAHLALGGGLTRLGRFAEAKRSFDHWMQLNPGDPSPLGWIALGNFHYAQGETRQAVEFWERARTMGASWAGPHLAMLIHYYESAGRHEDAQAIVQAILSSQPQATAEQLERSITVRVGVVDWIPQDLVERLRSAGLP